MFTMFCLVGVLVEVYRHTKPNMFNTCLRPALLGSANNLGPYVFYFLSFHLQNSHKIQFYPVDWVLYDVYRLLLICRHLYMLFVSYSDFNLNLRSLDSL